MFERSRREVLRDLGLAVMAAASVDTAAAQHVHQMAADDSKATGGVYRPKAFNAHEYATLERLTDLILPPEGDLPGARAAGAAAWIDMLAAVNTEMAEIYTGGLAGLDHSMLARSGEDFVSAPLAEQTAYLDLIAYRKNKSDETAADIVFFDWARHMTVDAFYTSKIGIKALDYRGNTPLSKYEVPVEALDYALKKSGFA
ncbi:MAG TPA: gluconate 2-dehydrogenase subunit 3 family protein [Bryobacteraceae bacterium]|nr:gluconate 2-dehydrogenase subunit 3 family protein [Bryobacteraceae bacterium]